MRHIALLALFLTACGHDVALEPKPVDIPVSVPCKAPAITKPIWATTSITDKSTMFEKARALAATNEQRKSYEVSVNSALISCQ